MTDDWFETMDQGLYTGVIFLDLRKAFDVVNLDLLVTKLQMYGCSSSVLRWFKSYLWDRRQCVNIAGTLSDTEVLKSGVPQGSNVMNMGQKRIWVPASNWTYGLPNTGRML